MDGINNMPWSSRSLSGKNSRHGSTAARGPGGARSTSAPVSWARHAPDLAADVDDLRSIRGSTRVGVRDSREEPAMSQSPRSAQD